VSMMPVAHQVWTISFAPTGFALSAAATASSFSASGGEIAAAMNDPKKVRLHS
jgi:hypothetical protein